MSGRIGNVSARIARIVLAATVLAVSASGCGGGGGDGAPGSTPTPASDGGGAGGTPGGSSGSQTDSALSGAGATGVGGIGGTDGSASTGSVSGGATSAGAAPTLAYGTVTGFGSLVVNGVRYDDSAALFEDDAGRAIPRTRIRLGTTVAVSGEVAATGTTGVARRVVLVDDILAPLRAVDTGAGTLSVLGARVRVSAGTVLEGVASLPDLAAHLGEIVEVHGPLGPDGVVAATRVELRGAPVDGMLFKGRGVLRALEPSVQHFRLGTGDAEAVLCYCHSLQRPTDPPLAEGRLVRFWAWKGPAADGVWYVNNAHVIGTPAITAQWHVEIEGAWIPEAGMPKRGTVSGVAVDLSVLPADRAITPASGQQVEIKGTWVNGVLAATRARIKAQDEFGRFELRGALEAAAGGGADRWQLQGVPVDVSAATFERGTRAQLAAGVRVEVRGSLTAGVLRATLVRFET